MKTQLLSAASFVVLFTATGLTAPSLAQQGPPDGLAVRILNTPVPITGSTTVSGSVAATQNGSWTVNANIQGSPNVTIANTPAAPALSSSVDDPGRSPYQASIRLDGNCTTSRDNCSGLLPDIPAGKRLVIQHVSVFALDSKANYVRAFIANSTSHMLSVFLVPVSPPASVGGPQVASGDQAVQFYIDGGAGSNFPVSVSTDGDFGPAAQVAVTLTGYLLTCSATLPCSPISPQ